MEHDAYRSPDPLVEQLNAVVEAAIQVDQVQDSRAKKLLLKAIGIVVDEMEPGLEFEPELHLIRGGKV